jgi:hypothetical protein
MQSKIKHLMSNLQKLTILIEKFQRRWIYEDAIRLSSNIATRKPLLQNFRNLEGYVTNQEFRANCKMYKSRYDLFILKCRITNFNFNE